MCSAIALTEASSEGAEDYLDRLVKGELSSVGISPQLPTFWMPFELQDGD